MSISLDQDALANLTPEERAAFDEPEYSPAELAAMQALADKAGDDEGDDDEVLDANGIPVAAPAAAAADADPAKPAAPAAEVVAEVATPAPAPTPQATYKAELPADYDAKVQDLTARTAELRANFKSGDLEFDDYEAQLATLNNERESLTMARAKAEISQEMTAQQAANQWESAIGKLFDTAAKDSGVDYRKDQDRAAELDQFIKILANNPAHADKSMDWFLTEGHKRVLVLNGQALKAAEVPAKNEGKPNAQVRTPPASPKNLAQVPGGDGPGDVGGEFAHLDALGGNDLESAIAKMTPAQREKYSRGG